MLSDLIKNRLAIIAKTKESDDSEFGVYYNIGKYQAAQAMAYTIADSLPSIPERDKFLLACGFDYITIKES